MKKTKNKKIRIIVLSIVGVLIAGRIYLPTYIKKQLNSFLYDKVPGYTGQVQDVDVSIIRGAYSIEGFSFKKKKGDVVSPFVYIDDIDISLSWKALFRRRILMDLYVFRPELTFIDSANENKQQLGQGTGFQKWQEVYKKLIPVKLENLKIRQGKISFLNNDTKVPIEIFLGDIKVDAKNINNSKKDKDVLVSDFKVSAIAQKHAELSASGSFNVISNPLMFDLNAKLENFKLVSINEFLSAYGPMDLTSGTFNFYTELASKHNKVVGYIKPTFDNVDVIDGKESLNSLRKFGLEVGSAVLNLFFRNGKTISVASKIPIEGDLRKPNLGLWQGFKVALDNAWGSPAVEKKIDNEITIKDASKSNSK